MNFSQFSFNVWAHRRGYTCRLRPGPGNSHPEYYDTIEENFT